MVVALAVVVVWAACGGATIARRRAAPLGYLMLGGALAGAAAVVALPVVALLPAAGMHLLLSLPDGTRRARRRAIIAGYAASVAVGVVLWAEGPAPPLWPLGLEALVLAGIGAVAANRRYRRSQGVERQRLQWFAWTVAVAAQLALVAVALRLLAGWPPMGEAIVLATLPIPFALALGASTSQPGRIEVLLPSTVSLAGLSGVVVAVYVAVVLGLGRPSTEDERVILGLSMGAAALTAVLWLPARRHLERFADRLVYGEREAPDHVLRTFGSRFSRAVPLDELLLQAAESLRRSMGLAVAEVWTGTGGWLERAVAVPDAPPASIELSPQEADVVARAGVSGAARLRVWLPQLLKGRDEMVVRVVPVTHSGRLLGLVVALRSAGGDAFRDEEDAVLVELARQMGLALHNVELDSALQASLDEVHRQAEELRMSRARVVAAADAARRKIERDLHDGAQQHLVALAVTLGLVRQIAKDDPGAATELLDQLASDVQEAVQELRNLAHGIYPPLLVDRGLSDALAAAANRAAIPTTVESDGLGRYSPDIEAAVYFCCIEALQNAGKHAGGGAKATIRVWEEAGGLLFQVGDDGQGFDTRAPGAGGAGFVNMADRLGAIGGSLDVRSAPAEGTTVAGRIPLLP